MENSVLVPSKSENRTTIVILLLCLYPEKTVILKDTGTLMFFGEGNGTPLQYSCLENPMDGGAWWATVHGVAKSRTRLSDFTFTFHFHELEKEMAIHSSVLAWRIPGMGEPGGLLSMGSHRVRYDWSDVGAAANVLAELFTISRTWKPIKRRMNEQDVLQPSWWWLSFKDSFLK